MIRFLIWNIRGIADSMSNWCIKKPIMKYNLELLVVIEPLFDPSQIASYAFRLGFEKHSTSLSGKLWIFWKDYFDLEIFSLSEHFITIDITMFGNQKVNCTFVYAPCTRASRQHLWQELLEVSTSIQGPWLMAGDFNVVANVSEYAGFGQPQFLAISDFVEFR